MKVATAGNWRKGHARGFTLVELMISMVLGLLVVGSVIGVLLANKRSYGTNQGLSQVQESARTAYELLAHDIRQADGSGCGTAARTANVLNGGAAWWDTWFGLAAYDASQTDPAVAIGTAVGDRVAGTDSIHVESLDGAGLSIALHDAAARRLDINIASSDFVGGDILMVCDFDHNTIFQASNATQAGGVLSVFHDDAVGTPGNCSQGLGFPTNCATAAGNVYAFPRNAQIGRLIMTAWYIGNNGRAGEGGRSLYRRRMGTAGALVMEEVVAGVTDMQLQFRANASNDIIPDPSLVADWTEISSVLIRITAQSTDANVSADPALNGGRIERTFNYLISLRNRLQ